MKEGPRIYMESRDDMPVAPCGHIAKLPNAAFADKIKMICGHKEPDELLTCQAAYEVEVIDLQGTYYCQFYVEGEDTSLMNSVDALIQQHGLMAVYGAVKGREGFCRNCGVPNQQRSHTPIGLGMCEIGGVTSG